MKRFLFSFLFLMLPPISEVLAQSEPIKSPQDAACRDEARDKVFSAPNPGGLSPYNLGAKIYGECMERADALDKGGRRRRAPAQ